MVRKVDHAGTPAPQTQVSNRQMVEDSELTQAAAARSLPLGRVAKPLNPHKVKQGGAKLETQKKVILVARRFHIGKK